MKIVPENEADLKEIARIFKEGGLVIFPSETTYGAAVDATNSAAVNKLSAYKQRPIGKPYSVMVTDIKMAREYAELNRTAEQIYKNFLPGPVTVVSKGKHTVAAGVESERGDLGIRIPDYPFLLKLIKVYGKPLTATSANASYNKRPYKISDIWENISEKQKRLIDLIIDAGELPHNDPSTVVDTTLDDKVILRQGEIRFEGKDEVLSRSEEETRSLGKELWQKFEKQAGTRAIIYALEGPMGAGKTILTKGMARAMGITEEIVSPTFNLELEYLTAVPSPSAINTNRRLKPGEKTRRRMIHMDAWRIQNDRELDDLGMRGFINDKSVLIIEWADRAAETIRKYCTEAVVVWVKIGYGKAENERKISWGNL